MSASGHTVLKIILFGQAGLNAVKPGILNLLGFLPQPRLQENPNFFLKVYKL